MSACDVAIVGAGAAGLFCAGIAAQQGLSVVLIDHSAKLAEKIRISGGGRSNFTNKDIDVQAPHKHFIALTLLAPQPKIHVRHRKRITLHRKQSGHRYRIHTPAHRQQCRPSPQIPIL